MRKVLVSVYPWENPVIFSDESHPGIQAGEKVVVFWDGRNDLGTSLKVIEGAVDEPQGKIIRVAKKDDLETFSKLEKKKDEFVELCRKEAKKRELPMKIADARLSLDEKRIVFVFTAEGRIDFRELVKVLSVETQKNIRMQQIGSRDEAKKLGGFGVCGRELCCAKFFKNIPSITTDMARIQNISYRGTEKLSGLCGRLKCCLSFEAEQYKKLLEGMPETYSVVDTGKIKGTVVEVNPIKQEIRVKTEDGKYVTIKKEDFKT